MVWLPVLAVLLFSATAPAFSPTWALFSGAPNLEKADSLTGLTYVRVLNYTNGTACGIVGFDSIVFDGVKRA